MNINVGIVDQQVAGILEAHPELLPENADPNQQKSAAFVLLCIARCLDMELQEAADFLTDGGNDAGIDGLYVDPPEDNEFQVTLLQGKYKANDLDGEWHFPENAVQKAIAAVQVLFDPAKKIELNERLAPPVEGIRSLVRDGYFPNVRVVLCNNGKKWNKQAQNWIEQSGLPEEQVEWLHFNHDSLAELLRKQKAVDASVQFVGDAVVEEFNFRRVLIGKVQVAEVAELFNQYNDRLLQRNIRHYLGLRNNRVNSQMRATLLDTEKRDNFYFFNNGITIICKKFRHNALQGKNYQVRFENMQIINGGQTCKTIQRALNESDALDAYAQTYVMARVYELAEDGRELVHDITCATNNQNPVDLRDLRSNDDIQKALEIGIRGLGYTYKRQRAEGRVGPNVITSDVVAEAVLAIWREQPHQAVFFSRKCFGKFYDFIFKGLNAAQAVLAVLIFRSVEAERKRPTSPEPPVFLPYASRYISMLVGRALLRDANLHLEDVSHQNFRHLKQVLEDRGCVVRDCQPKLWKLSIPSPMALHKNTMANVTDLKKMLEARHADYHAEASKHIDKTLKKLYGDRQISLQQLSATFRRGDLLEMLDE